MTKKTDPAVLESLEAAFFESVVSEPKQPRSQFQTLPEHEQNAINEGLIGETQQDVDKRAPIKLFNADVSPKTKPNSGFRKLDPRDQAAINDSLSRGGLDL